MTVLARIILERQQKQYYKLNFGVFAALWMANYFIKIFCDF